MKQFSIIFGGIIIIIFGVAYFLTQGFGTRVEVVNEKGTENTGSNSEEMIPVEPNEGIGDGAPALDELLNEKETVLGTSVDGTGITAYHYGTGDTELLFVGGIHGGYSWNTVLVAYELMDYLEENPENIPKNVKVTVIPVLNPDGLQKVVGTSGRFTMSEVSSSESVKVSGRFNADDVDLNRNFDCDWKSTGTWQNKAVSGGSEAFSEPESKAVRDYVMSHKPAAVVAWYSAAGGVFSSSCHDGVLAETSALTKLYAKAAGYKAYEDFDFYAITGDMMNWLAKMKIPAISVLLTTHESVEWDKNKVGVQALFEHYTE